MGCPYSNWTVFYLVGLSSLSSKVKKLIFLFFSLSQRCGKRAVFLVVVSFCPPPPFSREGNSGLPVPYIAYRPIIRVFAVS